jgi:HlyD family secretion protein
MLVGIVFVLGEGVSCVYASDEAPSKDGPRTTAQVASGKKVVAVGTIEPSEIVDACAQVAGRIVSLGVDAEGKRIDFGSAVEAGTVLAQIDSELYRVRVDRERAGCARANAELDQARIKREHAEAQWQRVQGLKKNNAVADPDFDQAGVNYRLAKAAVAAAEALVAQSNAALRQAEIELSHTAVKSPIKGLVVDRRVNAGQIVAPAAGTPAAFLIAKVDPLQVWASVAEPEISKIHPQQAVRFTVASQPGKTFEGRVQQIRLNATMAQNQVLYTVVIAISGETKELLPYMTAYVEFQ